MSVKITDNTFPCATCGKDWYPYPVSTEDTEDNLCRRCAALLRLRDRFASAALEGVLACGPRSDGSLVEDVTEIAYRLADAMLAARKRK
jgi:hypothetical protein